MFQKKTKIYFVHIPKNAGNSIRPFCKKENINVLTHNIRKKRKRLLSYYRKKHKHVHAFCISRNPYDRLVSAYHYLYQGGGGKHDIPDKELYVDPYTGFKDFVLNGLEEASQKQLHFLPQVFWILNSDGLPEVETILRQEYLQKDFDAFSKEIVIKNRMLQVTNPSKRKPWMDYYDEETKKKAQNIYKQDFEFLGYPM
jgi:ribosomal protein S15P/S13E